MVNIEDRKQIETLLEEYLDSQMNQILISNSTGVNELVKVRLRPLLLRGELVYQAEELRGKQAFHKNLLREEAVCYITELLDGVLKQMELTSAKATVTLLVSRKGKISVKIKKHAQITGIEPGNEVLSHNRQKKYILEEGVPVPFLVDLGVMTADGKIVRTRYDKFRQMNRFLEFIEDILPKLKKEKETTIIDFGCGKSYLTFAMYYYLKILKGYPIRIIGLDLKKDVIEHCSRLSEAYGYDSLKFYCGDIASFEGVEQVDMVVTLHACDTATDYALAKAVKWGAKVILSVPCCQHELNGQMENELFAPVFQYGIIKERMAALYTDALRAQILENQGYRTQILEFIDMEHTPKNILIRAVKQGDRKDNAGEIQKIMEELHVAPKLAELIQLF